MTTPTQMPESLKVVAYRVDWPASDSIGRDRFFGADDTQRMNNHTSHCNGVAVAVPLVLKTDADALQSALNDRDAEIERLKKDARPNLLPIATAPKYGDDILLYWRTAGFAVGRFSCDEHFSERPRGWESPEFGWRCDGDEVIPKNQQDCVGWLPLPKVADAAIDSMKGETQ